MDAPPLKGLWNTLAIPERWETTAHVASEKLSSLLSFFHHLTPRTWLPWYWLMVGPLLLACLTYLSSTIRFHMARRRDNDKRTLQTPLVPYWVPGLFHSVSLFSPPVFLPELIKRFGTERPVEVRAGWLRFIVIANPELIKTVFRKSKQVANKSTTLFALEHLMGLPKDAVRFFRADNSGLSATPRKSSAVPEDSRINFLVAHSSAKLLQGVHLEAMSAKYLSTLFRTLDAPLHKAPGSHRVSVGSGWTEFPDLYTFLQRITIGSTVEAIAGSKLLELYPGLVDDLPRFQSYVPKFLQLLPRWLIPEAFRVRDRLLGGIKAWHVHAHQHSDCNRLGPDDPEWEPYFGIKLVRRRQQYALELKEMTADARAAEDLGLLFASTANMTPAAFWLIFEALKDPILQSRLKAEVSASLRAPPPESTNGEGNDKSHDTPFDIATLLAQPLLQSAYAESLRLFVSVLVSRVAEYGDVNIAGYTVAKDNFLVMYSHLLALNPGEWARAGRTLTKSLEEFDAERFLVEPGWTRPLGKQAAAATEKNSTDTVAAEKKTKSQGKSGHVPLSYDGRRFSMDGLLGLWIPYGGGDHICPGRHLAKRQILLTFAALFTKFDLELTFPSPSAAADVKPDMRHAGFGALPPLGKVPFRMRRKVG
ncbi:cytochrome P450 [Podospora appendiculata]|uniref:Cytochrome P450 n=1 Tax=Podospora appendiculata TaxID=314037 RepID=A0AAE1C8I1_9PEZI|nr:cytochrome P450 [Podospora appendiculata]